MEVRALVGGAVALQVGLLSWTQSRATNRRSGFKEITDQRGRISTRSARNGSCSRPTSLACEGGRSKSYDVRLATSYYSDTAADHDAVTARKGSHTRTRASIQRAQQVGLALRGGVIQVRPEQRTVQAQQDLNELGLTVVGADRSRAFGRAGRGAAPTMADLCGHCADGKVAIGPDGDVWPCVLGRFISLGNVKGAPIADIWSGPATRRARSEIQAAHGNLPAQSCTPPQFLPMCGPCSPCVPSVGHCDPRVADGPAATIGSPAGD
ncbi:SPASM domain-containing protein [Streptomyces sp. NBUA17]|uniref:SPASM domain-containing protein n=1 Tax=Streptomyces sp. NBUA17 TaxID=3062275 RepID=UPI0037D9C06F